MKKAIRFFALLMVILSISVSRAQHNSRLGGEVYTFVITGNKMTRTQIMLAPYNEIVIKQEDISERM